MNFKLILVLLFMFSIAQADTLNKKEESSFQKAHHLMFHSSRNTQELGEALSILEKLYSTEVAKAKKDSQYKKDVRVLIDYSYGLQFKAAYTYPREGDASGNWKSYVDIRLKHYRQAESIADEMLLYKTQSKETQSTIRFIAGLVKGEIAGLTSSPYLVIQGKKLLEQALKIDDTIQNGAIYLALGRMYAKTPRILFGNTKHALNLLKKAQTNFKYPSIVAFYFEADTLIEKTFSKVKKNVQIQALEAMAKALEWIGKREKIPYHKPNALTPEELDAIKVINEKLKLWECPTELGKLKAYIAQLSNE